MYPNEYATNSDCKLELNVQSSILSTAFIQIEVLEFDMESSDDLSDDGSLLQVNSVESAIRMLNSNQRTLEKKPSALASTVCNRDYFAIGEQIRLCGSLSPFMTILNVAGPSTFKFYSDDALTRRGFWLKFKGLIKLKLVLLLGIIKHI